MGVSCLSIVIFSQFVALIFQPIMLVAGKANRIIVRHCRTFCEAQHAPTGAEISATRFASVWNAKIPAIVNNGSHMAVFQRFGFRIQLENTTPQAPAEAQGRPLFEFRSGA